MGDLEFDKIDELEFPSKKDDQGNQEKFVLNKMSGGKLPKPMLFINRSDKRKGLVVNSVDDIPALIELLMKNKNISL